MSTHIADAAETRTDRLTFCLPEDLEGLRILDVGCGPGVQIRYLTERNFVVGVDAGFPLLQRAHANGSNTCQFDANKGGLPFADRLFDVVICTDVLEHVFAPQDLLAEIHRVLKPDGFALLGIPNHLDITGRLRILFGGNLLTRWDRRDFHAWDFFHIHFWTLPDFHDFLDQGGFYIDQPHHHRAPSHFISVIELLLDPAYVKDWHRRHAEEGAKRIAMTIGSAVLRYTFVARLATRVLPRWKPSLFCWGFLAQAKKRPDTGSN